MKLIFLFFALFNTAFQSTYKKVRSYIRAHPKNNFLKTRQIKPFFQQLPVLASCPKQIAESSVIKKPALCIPNNLERKL